MKNLLLHICCAPDATVPVLDLLKAGYNVKGFFYGNNIQPLTEYEKRLEALKILVEKTNLDVEIAPYNPDEWLEKTSCLKNEPEGGKRCELCFRLQFEAAAMNAKKFSCNDFCTTLTISPHKNVNKICKILFGVKTMVFYVRLNYQKNLVCTGKIIAVVCLVINFRKRKKKKKINFML